MNEKTLLNMRASAFFEMELVTAVSRQDFFPVPNTDSIMIRLRKFSESDYRKRGMEFILKEIMLQRTKKLRNAMMEALINLRKLHGSRLTKRESREIIGTVKLVDEVLEKKVMDLTYPDYVNIKEALDFIL
jgi:16S rRNA A1518/A1519 N6-dimethyltransferase RsmA/KsgA/DIM1 with predicted DNA glycosylase/AP lyase activity